MFRLTYSIFTRGFVRFASDTLYKIPLFNHHHIPQKLFYFQFQKRTFQTQVVQPERYAQIMMKLLSQKQKKQFFKIMWATFIFLNGRLIYDSRFLISQTALGRPKDVQSMLKDVLRMSERHSENSEYYEEALRTSNRNPSIVLFGFRRSQRTDIVHMSVENSRKCEIMNVLISPALGLHKVYVLHERLLNGSCPQDAAILATIPRLVNRSHKDLQES